MDAFAILRLAVGSGFLAVAAASDVRTRRVRDPVWVALGTVGLALLLAELANEGAGVEAFAVVGAAAILFYSIFYGDPILDEDGVHLRLARLGLFALAALLVVASAWWVLSQGGDVASYVRLLTMPAIVLIYQGFYLVGILRGGADAKGLIALALLVPLYPAASPFPLLQATPAVTDAMRVFFPFSLIVLADAAVLTLAVPLGYIVVNLVRREFEWPVGFLGTKVPIDAVPRHAWTMERLDARGERYAVLVPSRKANESEEIAKLRAAGLKRIWVQRKLPFVVFLFLGFLVAFFVGNLVVGFLTAVLPPP